MILINISVDILPVETTYFGILWFYSINNPDMVVHSCGVEMTLMLLV